MPTRPGSVARDLPAVAAEQELAGDHAAHQDEGDLEHGGAGERGGG